MIGKSNCKTCNKRKDIELWDYSGMGCKHNKQEGFACLAFVGINDLVIHIVGIEENSGMCEMYLPKEGEQE